MTAQTTEHEQLVARSVAVEQLYGVVADLGLETNVSLALNVHGLTREQFDRFNAPEEGGVFSDTWRRRCTLYPFTKVDGEVWGVVTMTLFTDEPPVGGDAS